MRESFKGKSGRIWSWDPQLDNIQAPGAGSRFHARERSGRSGLLHIVWADLVDPERRARALRLARHPAVVDCASIRQFLDEPQQPGNARLASVWEWATCSLLECRVDATDRTVLADEVETTVAPALRCLHDVGLVHSDVAPNNILRVDGIWKLSDLDMCVHKGEEVVGVPMEAFRDPATTIGSPATPASDVYSLKTVLAWLRAG